MADEELAIVETTGQETATVAETTTEEPVNLNAVEETTGQEQVAETTEDDIEWDEIEWDDGRKYPVPKAIVPGVLKNKDYTTKTQETAALRKALEAKEAQIEERLKVTEAELDDRATMRSVDKQLEAYAKLTPEDWAYHEAQDPARAQQAFRHYQLLKDQKAEVSARLDAHGKERSGKAEQEFATRVQETRAHAQKLPGFNPDPQTGTIPTLVGFAHQLGIPEDAIKRNWSPTLVDLLHFARIGKMTTEKQATAPKLPNTPLQPLNKVNGKSTPGAAGDLSAMDMEAYVQARKKGVGGKALS